MKLFKVKCVGVPDFNNGDFTGDIWILDEIKNVGFDDGDDSIDRIDNLLVGQETTDQDGDIWLRIQ